MTNTARAAWVLSLVAFGLLVTCVIWVIALGPGDWGVIVPLWLSVIVGQPLAIAGLLCLFVDRVRTGEWLQRALWVAIADLLVLAVPWLSLAFAG